MESILDSCFAKLLFSNAYEGHNAVVGTVVGGFTFSLLKVN